MRASLTHKTFEVSAWSVDDSPVCRGAHQSHPCRSVTERLCARLRTVLGKKNVTDFGWRKKADQVRLFTAVRS